MKTLGQHAVVARILGQGLVLATLCATVLSAPGIAWAQSKPVQTEPSAALGQAARQAPPATQPTPSAATGEPAPKGAHEGIKVHGHWTIEVRNPDGKLVSHTEFENLLVQPYGANYLTAVLLGNTVPGGYTVILGSDTTGLAGPCPSTHGGANTACNLLGSLVSPEPAAFGDLNSGCGGTGFLYQITPLGPCFPLSIAPIAGSLSFTGTAVASTAVNITDVFLSPIACSWNGAVSTTISPNACAMSNAAFSNLYATTHKTLPTPGVPITAAGQLISVNVQLSFQ